MTQTIGFIGVGAIGSGLARLAVRAGFNVVLSNSRDPESVAGQVAELGSHARAATPAEAARQGDLLVVAVPFKAYKQLPADALAGKVVIDTMNYYPERDGRMAEVEAASLVTTQRSGDPKVVLSRRHGFNLRQRLLVRRFGQLVSHCAAS